MNIQFKAFFSEEFSRLKILTIFNNNFSMNENKFVFDDYGEDRLYNKI